jgi:hypothetical protein
MLSLPELLRRFRRVWVPPGAAFAHVAPPVDVSARLRAELQPVLLAIAEMQRRAAAMRQAAEARSAAAIAAAERSAADAVRQAEVQAPDARTAAAHRKRDVVESEVAAALKAAEAEAARIEAESAPRLPELVKSVEACVVSGSGLAS